MMIRNPLGLRLDPDGPVRDQIFEAARLGAKGVVLDAIGDLAPQRLAETGRRELRHILRTVELSSEKRSGRFESTSIRRDAPSWRRDSSGARS